MLEVEGVERQRQRADVTEAGSEDVAPAPEELLPPRGRLRPDEVAERHVEAHHRERVDERRAPRHLDEGARTGLHRPLSHVGHERGRLGDGLPGKRRAELQAIAAAQQEPAARDHREAALLDVRHERRIRWARRRRLRDLARPQEEEILLDVGGAMAGLGGEAPRHGEGDWAQVRSDVGHDEQRSDPEVRMRARGEEHLGRARRGGRDDQKGGNQQSAAAKHVGVGSTGSASRTMKAP